SPEQVAVLQRLGFSQGDYVTYMVAPTLAMMVVCFVVSTLIAWRRADDWMALLVALLLVTFGPVWITSNMPASSLLQIPNACLYFLFGALLMLVFSLFPTGQFVPRWTRWTAVLSLAIQVPTIFFPTAPFALQIHADTLGYYALLGEVAILVAVQLYR